MTEYNVRVDEKISTWRYNYYKVKAKNKRQAKQLLMNAINNFGPTENGANPLCIDTENIWFIDSRIKFEYDENMSVVKNENNATVEIIIEDEYLWDNKNKFEFFSK